jgi:hypothetical protein
MKNFVPFQRSGDLDLQVRTLLRAMLEPIDVNGREELLAQIPAVSVIGRYGLDCLLEVNRGTPRSPISSKEPVVCAPVDARPEDVEVFGEPYVGELELFVREGFLRILVYSPWCGPTELPDPVDIHPTAEITGYVVVDESRYRKGWSFSPGDTRLSREE